MSRMKEWLSVDCTSVLTVKVSSLTGICSCVIR